MRIRQMILAGVALLSIAAAEPAIAQTAKSDQSGKANHNYTLNNNAWSDQASNNTQSKNTQQAMAASQGHVDCNNGVATEKKDNGEPRNRADNDQREDAPQNQVEYGGGG